MKLPKSITSYWSLTFLKYVGKWQLGFIVSWPSIWLMKDMLHWSNGITVVCFQLIGAFVFWNIDRWIFTKKQQTTKI